MLKTVVEADRVKAEEVLERYKAGQRNFRRVNLRGQSFKGQDLSGADFSEADIRGTNFTNAILRGANFSYAKAGLQGRWAISLLIISLVLAATAGFISAFASYLVVHFFLAASIKQTVVPDLVVLVVAAAFFLAIIRQGLKTSFWAMARAIFADVAMAAAATATAIMVTFVGAIIGGFIVGLVAVIIPGPALTATALTATVPVAMAAAALSTYIGWRALAGEEKYTVVRRILFAFDVIGGTSFRGADLTDADFTQAVLNSVDFKGAILTDTNLRNEQVISIETDTKDTIDFTFRNGIDWQALLSAFKFVVEDEGTELIIQSIENRDNGVLVIKVKVPPETNKAKISNDFKQNYKSKLKALEAKYEAELKGKDAQLVIYRQVYKERCQENANLMSILEKLATSQSISIQTIATAEKNSVSETFNNDLSQAKVANFANKNQDHARQQANQHNYAFEQKQNLAEAAAEIQQLLTQLQTQGYSQEEAQQQVATNLAEQANRNPIVMDKLIGWGKSLGDTAARTTISEAAKEVFKLALKLSGILP